jgi:hypothetical protein
MATDSPTYTHFTHTELTAILDMAKERLTNSVSARKHIIERNKKLHREAEDKRVIHLDELIVIYRDIAMKSMMSLEAEEEAMAHSKELNPNLL